MRSAVSAFIMTFEAFGKPNLGNLIGSLFTHQVINSPKIKYATNESMSKEKLITWVVFCVALVVWNIFSYPIYGYICSVLTKIGIPSPIIEIFLNLLPIVLLLEIVVKLLFLLQALSPLKFIPAQAESYQHLNQDELDRYTAELEQLGFVQLTDYTFLSSHQGMARLFAHPEQFFFAEVGQVGTLPMFCSISCCLSKRWSLGVINSNPEPINRNLSAASYAFLRLPRSLSKQFGNTSVNLLLQSIVTWREQVSGDLGLEIIQDVSAETYFDKECSRRVEKRRVLLRKSITWGLLEMLWFSLNPRSEWLGDYPKLKAKRK